MPITSGMFAQSSLSVHLRELELGLLPHPPRTLNWQRDGNILGTIDGPFKEESAMEFEHSEKVRALQARVEAFMVEHIYPNEEELFAQVNEGNRWQPVPLLETLKEKAGTAGLWNLFLPESGYGAGLTNLEYAPLCEIMGRSPWAPEAFNCSAFAMTEPEVASSDATNIETRIRRDGDQYIINGCKWWTSGALDPRCEIMIVMGQSDPENPDRYRRQSMILVPLPHPGVVIKRMLPVFGYDEAPHGHAEVLFDNVRVPAANMLLGEGRGFEIAQGRLGPGRIHHCMRLIGVAERALERMCRRARSRVAFGKALADHGGMREQI